MVIKKPVSVKKEETMSGNLLEYALKDQSWPKVDSTTSMVVASDVIGHIEQLLSEV